MPQSAPAFGRSNRQSGRWRSGPWALMPTLAVVFSALVGCASSGPAPVYGWGWRGPVPDGYYLIRKGDTLGGIARNRRVSTASLIRWNALEPPYTVYAGRLLRVAPPDGGALAANGSNVSPAPMKSGGSRTRSATGPRSDLGTTAESTARLGSQAGAGDGGDPQGRHAGASRLAPASATATHSGVIWAWPIDGRLIQGFRRSDRTHTGLRIACQAGEPVRAAADGVVVYSGSGLRGYGNLIIVEHNDNYLSAYGFNRRLLVREGGSVTRGQAVAECGQGPNGVYLLHFEVRRDGAAVDPLRFLPPRI